MEKEIKAIDDLLYERTYGWIKASDQKPPENVSVFVFIPEEDNHVTVGMWDVSKAWVLLDDYRIPRSQVTYWRPYNFELPKDKTYVKSFDSAEELETNDQTIRRLQKEIFVLKRNEAITSELKQENERLKTGQEQQALDNFRIWEQLEKAFIAGRSETTWEQFKKDVYGEAKT